MEGITARTQGLRLMIDAFLKKLKTIENDKRIRKQDTREKAIERACKEELTHLREMLGIKELVDDYGIIQGIESGSVTTLHSYISDYRNAINRYFENDLNDLNSREIETGAMGERYIDREHLALRYFRKSKTETKVRKSFDVARIDKKQTTAMSFSRSQMIQKAVDLLQSKSYIGLALGIGLLTGRRPTEVLKTARFEKVDDSHVVFYGQLKTKGSNVVRDGYIIPTLVDADTICAALNRLRQLKDFSAVSENDVNKITAKEANLQVKRHFGGIVEGSNERSLVAKDLRAAYAQICWDEGIDKMPGILQLKHFATLLGHSEKDNFTAVSYMVFHTTP